MRRTDWPVKAFSVRPNGLQDRCFYCDALLAAQHKPDCVIRSRTVVVRTIIEHVIDIPEKWTEHDLHFRYNEGTWCGDNFADEFQEIVNRLDVSGACTCPLVSREFVREATAADETTSALFVSEIKS